MMFALLMLALLLTPASGRQQEGCPCDKFVFTGSIPTAHMTLDMIEERHFREIRGKVTNIFGAPLTEKAFIFVSSIPPNMSREEIAARRHEAGRSLIACETLSDGEFCFKNIKPGKYEVCATSRGFNNTCVLITVSRRAKKLSLDIKLEAGT